MADSKTAAGEKVAGLAGAISAGTVGLLSPDIKSILAGIASIEARLEVIQAIVGESATAKRSVRAPAKPGAAKAAAGSAAGSKITNTLLFFRHVLRDNIEDYRDIYAGPEVIANYANHPTLAKKDIEKDPGGYYYTLGGIIWKDFDKNRECKDLRARFDAWKVDQARIDEAQPLEAEAEEQAAEVDAEAEAAAEE